MKTHYLFSRKTKELHPLPKHISDLDRVLFVRGEFKGKVMKVQRYGTFSCYDKNGKAHNFYDCKHISWVEYLIRKLFQW